MVDIILGLAWPLTMTGSRGRLSICLQRCVRSGGEMSLQQMVPFFDIGKYVQIMYLYEAATAYLHMYN
jgi:hypothetical protein